MICGSYIVKHLLKPPQQGVCLSALACVWHLHGHDRSPSIWIETTARWRFTTSYERAQWLDICLYGVWGQWDGWCSPGGTKKPPGRLQRTVTAAGLLYSLQWPTPGIQGGEVLAGDHGVSGGHTSIQDPPPGPIKSPHHRGGGPQSAKRQIICLMAEAALRAGVLFMGFCVSIVFLWPFTVSPTLL